MESTHFESLYPDGTREKEIAKILAFIKEGNSCQIISLPGGGRSNLLGLLSYNHDVRIKHLGANQKWLHFVLSNFSEVRKRPLFDTTKFLFLNLLDSLKARKSQEGYQKIQTIFKESLNFNDELVLFQGLKQAIDLLSIEEELTVVFLFDRFEDYIPTVAPEFFTNLRVLRDRAKYRFSVVFSMHKPLEDLIGTDILSDFYQFVAGHIVYLPLLDKPGIDFRIAYMEKVSGKKLEKVTIDSIIKVTAGHPNLTRLAVEAALEMNHESGIMNQDFTNILLQTKSIKSALFDIWKSLTPEEQNLLSYRHSGKAASDAAHPESPTVGRDAGQARLADALTKRASMTQNESYVHLQNVGLIKNNKIAIPLFEKFVEKEAVQALRQNQQEIVFDQNSNDITKGDIILSDTLTPSEFKLLRVLLQNRGRVIERDEIITTVWADAKSTAGVTDQALDQLIFRVRKKIEDDPNNPTHLQTAKGRGFRFLP